MNLKHRVLLSLAIVGSSFQITPALAQSCTPIAAVPVTISTSGKHCLTQNVRYEGADYAIVISSDDVVLDFAGYTLTGGASAAANQFSRGILAVYRENVTIRNGAIRNFGIGIQTTQQTSSASRGILVEQMLLDGIRYMGMSIHGRNATIRDNRIASVIATGASASATGILVFGTGARIVNNSISTINAPYIPTGIHVAASGTIVQNNVISDMGIGANGVNGNGIYVQPQVNGAIVEGNRLSQSGVPSGRGISCSSDVNNLIVDANMVSGYASGISLSSCPNSKYKNNTVSGSTYPYSGGMNLGGNN